MNAKGAAITRLACLIRTFLQLCMVPRAGHGLLVLAVWTPQCCELKWHSVMGDLPHAALAEALAHSSRAFLQLSHIALSQDSRLFLTAYTNKG